MHLYVWSVLIVGVVGLGSLGGWYLVVVLGQDQGRMKPCDVMSSKTMIERAARDLSSGRYTKRRKLDI